MTQNPDRSFPWRECLAEFAGMALLLLVGLSLVTLNFGTGSPTAAWIPSLKGRQAITGFLFGGTGALIAVSGLGRASGAHINPVVTMTFWLFGKIDTRKSLAYMVAQLSGAVAGCLPLLFWGARGQSVSYGATTPGTGYSMQDALVGEAVTTFFMVTLLIVMLGFRQTRSYTPAVFPFLYAIMVPLEADISGTSTNPARSFGPAVVSGQWHGWWIYWVGPVAGALLACLACSMLAKRITVAKLYHFDSDQDKLLRRKGTAHPEKDAQGI